MKTNIKKLDSEKVKLQSEAKSSSKDEFAEIPPKKDSRIDALDTNKAYNHIPDMPKNSDDVPSISNLPFFKSVDEGKKSPREEIREEKIKEKEVQVFDENLSDEDFKFLDKEAKLEFGKLNKEEKLELEQLEKEADLKFEKSEENKTKKIKDTFDELDAKIDLNKMNLAKKRNVLILAKEKGSDEKIIARIKHDIAALKFERQNNLDELKVRVEIVETHEKL